MSDTSTNPLNAAIVAILADAETPGYQASFGPDEAEQAGAFQEDALTEGEALDSTADLPEALAQEKAPAFLDDDAGMAAVPPEAPTLATARELFGYRVGGDSLADTLAGKRPH